MGEQLFSEIGIIRAGELEEGPITPGQNRLKALEVGDLGMQSFELGAGDYAYFPRRVVHRAQILDGGDDVRYVFVRVGQGETLENVDGPEA